MAHPLAGRPAPRSVLVDVAELRRRYAAEPPDPRDPAQRIAFGTSGHRGSSLRGSFNEAHILAVAQAVCEHRRGAGIDGPLFIGSDTHGLSAPAERTALEVLAANGVEAVASAGGAPVPTPVISHAILTWNRGRRDRLADGVVVTPSHNPPEDGGIKYNPPNGGPADTDVTGWIERRANALLADGNRGVRRVALARASGASLVTTRDYVTPYVEDLGQAVDLDAVRGAGLRLGCD
ncbi:MAG: phosphoglucomutase, alpha-D-glucose phosphate-specific, partial [Anaeromyxobacteraceae bacterium]